MKKKAFTMIELLVIMAIIALLIGLLVPAINSIKKTAQKIQEVENTVVIKISNGTALVKVNQRNKIELKPTIFGEDVKLYLSDTPDNSEIIQEGSKFYLMWTPAVAESFKAKVITIAPNYREEKEITIFVE